LDCSTGAVISTLVGHKAKPFSVAWNPLIPNVLASGSDDNTIRIWNTKDGTSSVLTGHASNVRGLVWNTEIPWLLLSGSWDASIILWDV
jgi:WD repeat-containing protein 17